MSLSSLLERYRLLARKRSETLLEVQQARHEIASIEDRIGDLKDSGVAFDARDIVRAKDKKKRLLEAVAQKEHEVRLLDADMDTARMEVTYVED
jgi:seryl-tRNA synthetase